MTKSFLLLPFYLLISACVLADTPLPGQIIADPQHPDWLMRQGGEHVFLCGPGDPEGFLYRGIERPDGTRDGDQKEILRKLEEHGSNCLYLQAVRSHGGDGTADQNPFLGHDPARGVNPAIMDQWESWFQEMDEHGILIYFFFYDDSSLVWKSGDEVTEREEVFIRTLVRRFKHHRHLIWVLAEESEEAFSQKRAEALGRIIAEEDDHGHLIGNHHHSGTAFKSYSKNGPFTHYAIQLNVPLNDWQRTPPDEAGMKEDLLNQIAQLAGGRGCIIRNGTMVYAWGEIERPGDLASASKPLYSHLLFQALEEGLLESADDKVAMFRPCLSDLNPDLHYKDRTLSFRHLAFQTASLGYREHPGEAYDYNDHTMGLFWDVLVENVFSTPWSQARAGLFEPKLAGPLQFEDNFDFPVTGRTRGRPKMSPRDFARFGWLYLNNGRWGNEQIISTSHAYMAAHDPLPLGIPRTQAEETERCDTRSIGGGGNQADHQGGYSWLWWLNAVSRDGRRWWPNAPDGMFCALGHCGQRGLAILPSQQIVMSWNDAKELHCDRELGNHVFRLLKESVR